MMLIECPSKGRPHPSCRSGSLASKPVSVMGIVSSMELPFPFITSASVTKADGVGKQFGEHASVGFVRRRLVAETMLGRFLIKGLWSVGFK